MNHPEITFTWFGEPVELEDMTDEMIDSARKDPAIDYINLVDQINKAKARAHKNAREAAIMTLQRLGYTYHGGEQWKPPIGLRPTFEDGWLICGNMLYRLTDGRPARNRDEIQVTMADGSRSPEACSRRAGELLDRIRDKR